jgi:hypothetical protein
MQQAWLNLQANPTAKIDSIFRSKKVTTSEFNIYTSHAQYSFAIQDSTEYAALQNDTLLAVSETMLTHLDESEDEELAEDPDVEDLSDTEDSSFAGPTIHPLYSVTTPSHELLSVVDNSLIESYYFPAEDEEDKSRTDAENKLYDTEFFDFLETEAFKLTDNINEEDLASIMWIDPNPGDDPIISTGMARDKGYDLKTLHIYYPSLTDQTKRRRKWTPSGTVRFQETSVNGQPNVGVPGARIRVRKWGLLPIRKAHTRADGTFSTKRCRTKRVKYSIYFKNRHEKFVIKAGTPFWNARYVGKAKHKRRAWNPRVFSSNWKRHFYAQVQFATFDYYNRISGQYNIPEPGPGFRELWISAKHDWNGSSQFRGLLGHHNYVCDIRVTRTSGNGQHRGTIGVYATTVHELTHSAHYENDWGIFHPLILFDGRAKERDLMRESWAEGVETIATNDRYNLIQPNYFIPGANRGWNTARQEELLEDMDEYTPLAIDLTDNFNQFINVGIGRADDRVIGYSLQQLWQSLEGRRSLQTWRNAIINDHTNNTELEVTALFDQYQNVADGL